MTAPALWCELLFIWILVFCFHLCCFLLKSSTLMSIWYLLVVPFFSLIVFRQNQPFWNHLFFCIFLYSVFSAPWKKSCDIVTPSELKVHSNITWFHQNLEPMTHCKKKKTDQRFIKIYNNQYTIRGAQNHLERWQTGQGLLCSLPSLDSDELVFSYFMKEAFVPSSCGIVFNLSVMGLWKRSAGLLSLYFSIPC